VQFESATSLYAAVGGAPIEVVTQQAGEVTVRLSRIDTAGSLQVQVTTDPSSPYVGVNVGAVDQTVTFAGGQSQATLTVPILAGAPNPGQVDVFLRLWYTDPSTHQTYNAQNPGGPGLDLKIVAADPTLPPNIAFMEDTAQGFLLVFNRPMNPAGASDVNNYTVKYSYGYVKPVKIQTAQYDPATQSVLLIPKHPNPSLYGGFTNLTQVHTARTSVRRGHRSNVAESLTDLQGNPINASTTPGTVELRDTFAPPTGVSF
jgi:hypothetical protein